jgi:hypothetical protein
MSIGQIVVLTVVVGAFVVFAAVLGWGDYRAQQLARGVRIRKQATPPAERSHGAATASATAQARWPQPSNDRLQRVA